MDCLRQGCDEAISQLILSDAMGATMGRGLRVSIAPTVLAYMLLVLCVGILFGPALAGHERLAFRDVSHFYTPLFGYVAARQSEHWLPLWNPMDLTGMPLAGETTTSVFYPVRVLVYAVAPTFEIAITWYVVVHLLLAAVAIHMAAKSAGAANFGRAIAILTYPLAGPVFFLIYNPAFLVGAAWLPILIACGLQLLRVEPANGAKLRYIFAIAMTGMALAMPVLGGDPQTSIHVLLLGMVVWLVRFWGNDRQGLQLRIREFSRLATAFAIGCCISAPQLAASIDWSVQSDRILDHSPTDRYDFSVPAWHWFELIVPEASGRLFPIYERISNAIPGDGRSWVMTLYAGIIPLVLLGNRLLTRRLQDFDLWDYLIPAGLFFSISGPYWLLVTCVPGYDSFRYPGKWLPLVPLGLAIAASRQADFVSKCQSRNIGLICLFLSLISITIGLVSILASRMGATAYLESLDLADRFWGPLQPESAFRSIAWSAIASSLVATVFWIVTRFQKAIDKGPGFALAIVGLVACDMFGAIRQQVATIATDEEQSIMDHFAPIDTSVLLGRAMRTTENPTWPEQWREPHDGSKRLLEVDVSQRMTCFGRWHLANGQAVFNSVTSLRPQRIDAFWTALVGSNRIDPNALNRSPWPRIEHWLGIDHHLATQRPWELTLNDSRYVVTGAKGTQHTNTSPMFRWDTRWRQIKCCHEVSVADMKTRLLEIMDGANEKPPLVESDSPLVNPSSSDAQPSALIEVLAAGPDQWVFNLETADNGVLTVKSFQDGNWHAVLRSSDRPERDLADAQRKSTAGDLPPDLTPRVMRVDFLFMGIKVPPGRWEVTFFYRPWWLTLSLAVSTCGTIGVFIVLGLTTIKHFTAMQKELPC